MNNVKYNYKAAFFSITTNTPMHCGAGGENFWIIDKLIQRDETTNLPTINSTSLKGALREYMKDYLSYNEKVDGFFWATTLFQIFGTDNSEISDEEKQTIAEKLNIDLKKNKNIEIPGDFRFLSADLLSIPTHKEDKIKHVISCDWLKENLEEKLDLFNYQLKDKKPEDIVDANEYLSNEDFVKKVDDYNLPVVARNHLEDGQSTNLWYEQILPRGTKLYFVVVYNNENLFEVFKEAVVKYPVQIGANASVGYGFCKIEEIPVILKN